MIHDIAIIGAGIAGASLAAAIGRDARVLLLEAEDQPGYHATGRSAAFWSETYGGPGIQPLTSASEAGLRAHDVLTPLGSLHIGRAEDAGAIDALLAAFADTPVRLARVDPREYVPGLRADWTLGVIVENLLDTSWNETQFATESRLFNEPAPVEEIHFTPGTPFYLRGKITYSF